jgi:hypothetical protein
VPYPRRTASPLSIKPPAPRRSRSVFRSPRPLHLRCLVPQAGSRAPEEDEVSALGSQTTRPCTALRGL